MTSVEETLAWEAEQRPRAASAAIAGGVLTLAGNIMLLLLTRGGPTEEDGFISLTGALGARLAGEEPADESLIVRQVDYFGDNALLLSVSTVITTLAAICLGLVLLYLYRATRARNEQVGRLPLYAALAGLVLFPVGHLLREIGQWVGAAGFEDEAVRTAETARDIFRSGIVTGAGLIEVLGSFAIALALLLVCLNAMRVGLLTRFTGVLGLIVGGLTVFQLDQPQIVRAFWLVAVGLLIAGRTPSGIPPAWQTGRAEPWPSQQQLREQRRAATAPAAPEAAADPQGDRPQKRKRKRRR